MDREFEIAHHACMAPVVQQLRYNINQLLHFYDHFLTRDRGDSICCYKS